LKPMKYEIRLDRTKRLATQPAKGHNRWHPEIPPVLERIIVRERATAARGGLVMPPEPRAAIPSVEPILSQGLRTIPPRETGGNLDVKQLVKGTNVYLPVWTEGALFSIGDAHFAQGDGEVCGSAIEMSATFHLRFHLLKGAARERNIRGVQFSGVERSGSSRRYYATTGLSMRGEEVQESEDATLAARNALLAMFGYLQERGFTRQQAYAICSVAVDLRLSEVVDVPNFVVTAFLPLDIFLIDDRGRRVRLMHNFTPIASLLGGMLIGLSASAMLILDGKVAGISGILAGVLKPVRSDTLWRICFLGGLLAGGLLLRILLPSAFDFGIIRPLPLLITAGLLVGFGTRLGNGCTSGHGVCGVSRLSLRSLVATATFIITGALTVYLVNYVMESSR
jgi:acetamidase/formamidase family protein/sulfur transporter